jgi:hypothetical protein
MEVKRVKYQGAPLHRVIRKTAVAMRVQILPNASRQPAPIKPGIFGRSGCTFGRPSRWSRADRVGALRPDARG